MVEEYTSEVLSKVFGLLESDIAQIWADVDLVPEDSPADLWKKKLTEISNDYSFSSRYALMRILFGRAKATGLADASEIPSAMSGFKVNIAGKACEFRDFSLAHAETLTRKECNQYINFLTSLAALQEDSEPDVDEYLVNRAWYGAKRGLYTPDALAPKESDIEKHKECLSREEAFCLGHILQFSLEEMQWFLLRAFEVEDGFRYNQSNDLIEAYGFMTNAGWKHVQDLKKQYHASCSGTNKVPDSASYSEYTGELIKSLPVKFNEWNQDKTTMDAKFLEWMKERSSRLDAPSRTAGNIYRNLACYAINMLRGKEAIPEEEELADRILRISKQLEESTTTRQQLYKNGMADPEKCKEAADRLLEDNARMTDPIQTDLTKAWHVPNTANNGKPTATGKINECRTRVMDILAGKTQVEKSDLLYLLWYVFNYVWQATGTPDANTICCRILTFKDAAEDILAGALLPTFYPPHLLEQAMLLSIVDGGLRDNDPAAVYEYALESLRGHRERKEKES